jgi:hypothetical protein
MLILIALIGAAVVALVLWKAMNTVRSDAAQAPGGTFSGPPRPSRPRVYGPDDDPDFLRKLDEKMRRRDDPPAA